MKKYIALTVLSFLLFGCNPQSAEPSSTTSPEATSSSTPTAETPAPATATPQNETSSTNSEFLIQPGVGIGQITQDSTEAQLKEVYGAENVVAESIYVGDGMEWPGLAVFPNDPEKRVEVIFEEGKPGQITMLKLGGEKSVWSTAEGVTLGTDLATLEKLNGGPFQLMGLEWDFGGGITDWKGGKLKDITLRVGLNGEGPELSDEENGAILGDQQVMSNHPAMAKANPRVFQIVISYPAPE